MERSFESLMVEQCAPTLAGIKPASLFRCSRRSAENIRQTAENWDQALARLGLRVRILKECPNTGDCMIYIYRPDWVGRLLSDEESLCFLDRCGYQRGTAEFLLDQLSKRLCLEQGYPHEIGLFLGYPLSDVIGFIEKTGWNYTCCGCWKSYGDPEKAKAYFDLCRRCTSRYCELYTNGAPLLKLVVAA